MNRIGLIGLGKAGLAAARVLKEDPRFELAWIAKRQASEGERFADIPLVTMAHLTDPEWVAAHPVAGVIDFSSPEALVQYGATAAHQRWAIVSAISQYSEAEIAYAKSLSDTCRVMCSPNITLGINFLMLASSLLRSICPQADVAIVEQHFRDKPEVSGTARKLADALNVSDDQISSLRLGGIVGQHEVVFGFPHQTVRLQHESIRREAFGTGAAFAMHQLLQLPPGFHDYQQLMRMALLSATPPALADAPPSGASLNH